METAQPPAPLSERFTLELEFVHCLANPQYLQYLAVTFPHLLNPPARGQEASDDDSDAAYFARYLAYLYSYWRTPFYAKYLTHPGAVLGTLNMLQQSAFRRDIIRPDVIARLMNSATVNGVANDALVKGDEMRRREDLVVEGEKMDIAEG